MKEAGPVQAYVYAVLYPPEAVIFTPPVETPLQAKLVTEVTATAKALPDWLIVTEAGVVVQLLKSLTTMLYVPAARPVNMFDPWNVTPPSFE